MAWFDLVLLVRLDCFCRDHDIEDIQGGLIPVQCHDCFVWPNLSIIAVKRNAYIFALAASYIVV